MKFLQSLLSLFFLLLLSVPAFSQTDATINPIGLLFSSVNASIERSGSDHFGIEGSLSFNFSSYDIVGEAFGSNGFGIRAIGKYYFKPEKGIDKFHIGPYVRYGYNSIKYTDNRIKNSRISIGFYTGYKWVSQNNIIFELGFGLGRGLLNIYSDIDYGPDFSLDATGKLAVGYRF